MKFSLLDQLIQKEIEVFGAHTHPISTNIKTHLIPVAAQLLNRIPAYMPEYTLHNIDHCEAILSNINNIIPHNIQLNIVELTILIYSVYLHDIGMVINKNDAETLKLRPEFKKLFNEFDKETSEDEILTEFIRRTHVENSLVYIEKFKSDFINYKIDFTFKGIDISHWVKNVILSHAHPIEFIKNSNEYPIDKLIDTYHVDIQFLSMLLRLGDILDFDIFRTPPFLYQHINPRNQISINEWKKHQAIEGKEINETTVRFDAFCRSATIERLVREFAKWIEVERRDTLALLLSSGRGMKLTLNDNPVLKCRDDGSYVYTNLQLELDYERVLNILMGTELYDSPDIFLREILQNAYDACKCRADIFAKNQEAYVPKVSITYSTKKKELKITDNGIGIDKEIFQNYVITIGKSYYKSKGFQTQQFGFKPISNFGIGIISCFMVSNSIELESFKYYPPNEVAEPIHYILNIDQKYIDERKGSKNTYGTTITLRLKDDYERKLIDKSILEIIEENMTYQEIPIDVFIDDVVTHLNRKKIEVPEEYKTFNGILIFEPDSNEWFEGHIVIHGHQHQSTISQNKISQQCFTISNKNSGFPLNIPWLPYARFFINILAAKKINLKANRNKVHEDENFAALKSYITEYIINQFEQPQYRHQLLDYIGDARGNIISGNVKEYIFLTNVIPFSYLNSFLNLSPLRSSFKALKNTLQGKKVAVIHYEVLKYLFQKRLGDFLLKKYPIILIHDRFIQHFYQFSQPYINYHDIMVADISGLVYFELEFKKEINLNIDDYPNNYSWHREYDIKYKGDPTSIFCIVGNNQYNSLDLKFNFNHKIGQLLKKSEKTSYTKRFMGSFRTNFATALKEGIELTEYVNFDGEYYFMFEDNINPYSLRCIHFINRSFITSLNNEIIHSLLNHLAKAGYLNESEINDYLFSEEDFPSWWIKN